MKQMICSIGLLGLSKLIHNEKEENQIVVTEIGDENEMLLYCNIKERTMKIMVKNKNSEPLEEVIEDEFKKGLKDVFEGNTWEGDWYKEKPFGFGSYYDGDGNRFYSGFVFEGKKVGFGTEYFADTHTVDYEGNFLNDKRHWKGISYDRNGKELYGRDWRCGKNDFEDEIIVIEDNCEEDCLRVHDLMKELEIGENCYNEWKGDLVIDNYPNLQSIIIKKFSLMNLNSLKICNCEKLKTLEIGGYSFRNVRNMIIESI